MRWSVAAALSVAIAMLRAWSTSSPLSSHQWCAAAAARRAVRGAHAAGRCGPTLRGSTPAFPCSRSFPSTARCAAPSSIGRNGPRVRPPVASTPGSGSGCRACSGPAPTPSRCRCRHHRGPCARVERPRWTTRCAGSRRRVDSCRHARGWISQGSTAPLARPTWSGLCAGAGRRRRASSSWTTS